MTIDELKTTITNFINSNEEYIKFPMMPLWDIELAFKDLGFKKDEYDSNGWQVDFWLYFKHPRIKSRYLVSGGLWYNDGFVLSREECEDEEENE